MQRIYRRVAILSVAVSLAGAAGTLCAEESAEFRSLMNVGKAHLENADTAKAIEVLEAARELEPRSAPALRNLARAYLSVEKPELALQRIEEARKIEPDSVAASYINGVAFARLARFDAALPHLEQAVRLDPHTAALRFQLSRAYEGTGQHEKAIEQLKETIRLDRLHAAAHYRLARAALRADKKDEYRRHHLEFVRLRKLFGDSSKTPFALEFCEHADTEPAASANPPGGQPAPAQKIAVRFADVTDQLLTKEIDQSVATLAVMDTDKSGKYTLIVTAPNGELSLLSLSAAGKIKRQPLALKLAGPGDLQNCIVGNFHDEAARNSQPDVATPRLTDALLIGAGGGYLLKRTRADAFENVTAAAGLSGLAGRSARWVDYDHEGDLDLVLATNAGVQLWQNHGDGTFNNVTAEAGIPAIGRTVDVAVADLDADGAVDIVAARETLPTLVFKNRRAGQFAPMPEPPGPLPAARRVLVNDLNNDGWIDIVTVGNNQATILFGRTSQRQQLDLSGFNLTEAVLVDYDNDGWLDFCGVGHHGTTAQKGAIRIWRNGGCAPWTDVTAKLSFDGISLPPLRGVEAADLDTDGDTDLLLCTVESKLRVLRNEGGHEQGQLKMRLMSLIAQTGGIGTRVEVREDDFRVTRWIEQYLPVEIGIGSRKNLDSVQTLWPDGVVDNHVRVTPTKECLDVKIVEFAITGSCPFLYVWDGQRFRFVTDLIGNSALDFPLSRTVLAPVDGDEIVIIGDGDRFRPRDGAYRIKITSELREVIYMDHVRLLAVDHPRGVEIHSTDKLMVPPFPASQPRALGNAILPSQAHGDDGIDRTAAVQRIDGQFAPPGPYLSPPLRGVARPLSLTLEFGQIDPSRPLMLALTGWIDSGTSSSNIGAAQNSSVTMIPPRLEAQAANAQWVTIETNVGMPVGKNKTILCDLEGKLPQGTERLRLTGTYTIHWDRIALFEKQTLPAARIHTLQPGAADLVWRGFSDLRSRAPGHAPTPDFYQVSDVPAWPFAVQGWCTRYGDVDELTAAKDGQLVVINAGDVLTIDYPADKLPPVAAGMARTFLLHSAGWVKEGDYNSASGDRVEPLPVPAGVTQVTDDWRLRYNTRWVPHDRFAR